MLLGGFIACLFVGLLFFILSYLIWNKKELSLIAGYNEKTFKGDKNKLAKAAGSFLLVIGILVLILPLGLELIGSIIGIIFTIVTILGTIVLVAYMQLLNKK